MVSSSPRRACSLCGRVAPLFLVPEIGNCCAACAAFAEDEEIIPAGFDRFEEPGASELLLRLMRALSDSPPNRDVDERKARTNIGWLVGELRGERLAWAERVIETLAGMP